MRSAGQDGCDGRCRAFAAGAPGDDGRRGATATAGHPAHDSANDAGGETRASRRHQRVVTLASTIVSITLLARCLLSIERIASAATFILAAIRTIVRS